MTTEQLRMNAAAMLAHAEGKPVEFQIDGTDIWNIAPVPVWTFRDTTYRPKPEPVSRPWSKPEDVPGPVCWLSLISGFCVMVAAIDAEGVFTAREQIKWEKLNELGWLHSTDRINWKPCTVVESE